MNVFAFLVSLLLFVGGIFLLGHSFSVEGWELVLFFAGILVTTLGVVIPVHVMKRIDA
jgi:Ni,Fe-hydrogenase I cytochrome b subunit